MVERAEIRMKPREKNLEKHGVKKEKIEGERTMKKRMGLRVLSLLLAAVLVGQQVPQLRAAGSPEEAGNVEAEEAAGSRPEETAEGKSSEVVVGEVVENRAEREKHFRMEDGSFLAVDYGVPVHYEAEEEWEEIDNTLIPQAPSVGLALEGAWRPVVQYRAENGEESRSFAGSLAGGYVFAAETGEVGVRLSLWEEAGEPEAAETEAEETMGTEASTAPVSDEPEETVQETEPLEEPEEPTESPAAEAAIPSEETALEATAESEAEPETVPELNALGEIPGSEEPETQKPGGTQLCRPVGYLLLKLTPGYRPQNRYCSTRWSGC